ncbi:hypothetical protein [Portibacter marinus]|uniref:hypothetical protein n=1 Tax=Portibacter marinus TaxID=2898660 RepID=UPI001F1EE5A3|nr:hypothetical protein [Portibacter marinus]
MRFSHTCPKCSSTEIYVSKGRKHHNHGNKIMISTFKVVPLDHYTCIDCGYTEEWVTDKKSLDFLRRKARTQKPRDNFTDFV